MNRTMVPRLGLGLAFALFACGGDDDGASPDAAPSTDASTGGGADAADQTAASESEPNDGSDITEYNEIEIGRDMLGAIGTAGDADVFLFDATPGRLYRITLAPGVDSPLLAHLTAMDDGRGESPAGDDYVKIDTGAQLGTSSSLELLAMGEGGYFVAVRDVRNVGGEGAEGGPDFTYRLHVEEVAAPETTEILVPGSTSDSLDDSGAVDLYTFEGTQGDDIVIDMTTSGDVDGRLILYAESTGDWIARNDDRAIDSLDPLIDAPLTAGGTLILMVENIEVNAADRGYALQTSTP